MKIFNLIYHTPSAGILKSAAAAMIFSLLLSCATTAGEPYPDLEMNRGRFTDKDTYILKASGKPDKKDTSSADKQKSALKNAEKTARGLVLEYFIGYVTESGDGIIDNDFVVTEVAARFKKAIDVGTTIEKQFDKNGNCVIVYRVQKKNLKELLTRVPRNPSD